MRKSHFNVEFLVLLGPIISRLFTCSNVEKNKQRVLVLVLSLWVKRGDGMGAKSCNSFNIEKKLKSIKNKYNIANFLRVQYCILPVPVVS